MKDITRSVKIITFPMKWGANTGKTPLFILGAAVTIILLPVTYIPALLLCLYDLAEAVMNFTNTNR